MTKKLLASFVLTIIFAVQVYAQGRTVSGKVADKKGEAIPGANIVVKGNTAIATVSSDNGTYSLANVPDNAILLITASTFADIEVPIGTETVINITMNEDAELSTVVVEAAAGIKREKASLGFAVTSIDNSSLTKGQSFGAAAGLAGKVAGLQINQTNGGINAPTRITLRGARSILGNNQALIVIDGSQSTQAALGLLNPNDIETTTVLKGASSAALYGADASNGVLLVTTKKGKAGATTVRFSSTFQVERVAYMPKFQEQFGPGTADYGRVYMGGENQSFGPAFDGSTRFTGGTGGAEFDAWEDGTKDPIVYSPIKDQKLSAFNTGTLLQNDASVSGGTEKSKFYLSVQDVVQKGIIDRDKFRRTGVRLNASTKTERLLLEANLGYTTSLDERTRGQGGADFYSDLLQVPAHIPIRNYRDWQNFRNADGTINRANPNTYFSQYSLNPWFTLDNNRQNTRRNNITGNVNLVYDIAPWFNANYRLGATSTNNFSKSTTDKFTYREYRKTEVINFAGLGDVPGLVADIANYNTKLTQDFNLVFSNKNLKEGKLNSLLKATLVLGSNINEISTQGIRLATTSLVVPSLFNVDNRLGEITADPNFNRNGITQQRTIGIFADISLGFKNYLFLHASGRNDWDSRLDKENRSYFFPSADLSFVLSNAIPALKENNVLTFAKVFASAAKVGAINVAPYATKAIYGVGGGFPYGSLSGFTVGNRIVQQGLKPEFTTTFEVGAEIGLFDRINIDAAYYKATTTNQTLPTTVSSASGYTSLLTNIGATESLGFELSVRGDIIKLKNSFTWGIGANYTNYDNRVTSLFGDVTEISVRDPEVDAGASNNNANIFAQIGSQYPMLKVTQYLRDEQGRVVVDAITGYPKAGNGFFNAGQTNPRHTLGLNTTISYKGFSLYALADYRAGNVIYNDLGYDLVTGGVAAVTTTYNRERFIFPNSSIQTSTNVDGNPVYSANTSVSIRDGAWEFWDSHYKRYGENFVTSGAFWKLREARISYDIPVSILQEASKYIKGASISFVGRNLLMFVPKTNQFGDPEYSSSTSNGAGFSDSSNTPSTRTYGFNINVTL